MRKRYGTEPRVEAGSLEATRAALAESTDAPVVVVVGGDGTVREAAEALIGRGTPLAIVPAGTGNVLAGAIGIRGLRSGLDAIRHGQPRVLDLGRARWTPSPGDGDGRAHERIFAVACGMGLDARIMAAAEHEWKRRMRFGAYVGAAVREMLRLETRPVPHRGRWRRRSRSRDISPSSRTPVSSSRAGSDRGGRSIRATACSI